jgi:type IV secretion system protein VirD4
VYTLARLMLLMTVGLFAYTTGAAALLFILQQVPPEKHEMVFGALIGCVIVVLMRKKVRRIFSAMGTAAWASWHELDKAGMLNARTGLILGRTPADGTPLGSAVKALINARLGVKDACRAFFDNLNPRKRKQGQLVRLPQAVHTSIYAPTGGGKGVSCIVPFLLSCQDSCIIADGKDGELARLTAAARRRMGHQVILLDPTKVVTQRPDTLNILDFIDRNSPQAINEAAAVANSLVVRTGEEREPHWLDKAEAFLTALIALTVWHGQREQGSRSLLRVAEIASNPAALRDALKLMQAQPAIWNGSLARMGGMLSHSVADEFSSTLSTVGRFIGFMNSPSAAESLRSSSFDLSKLRKGRMSIYLIQKAADTRTGSPLLRLWLNACIREVMKGGLNQKHRVQAVIDEAGSVGKMDSISDVLNVGRGFGLRLQLYYQDIGQLKRNWENPQGVLANTTQIFFGVNDKDTAEYVSARLGPETILVEDGSSNNGWSTSTSTSTGTSSTNFQSSTSTSGGSSNSWKQHSRELLKLDEVIALNPRTAITLTPGVRPIWTQLIRWYEEPALFKRHGFLTRQIAAVWTLLISALLLFMAAVLAATLTSELNGVLEQQQQTQPMPAATYQPQPWLTPR